MDVLERRAAITGAGLSAVGRKLERTGLDLTLDAVLAALEDAGLTTKDIDGLSSWPGASVAATPGMSPVSIRDLKESLGLKLNWYSAGPEAPGQFAAVINAAMAVATGQARHVLCFRTLTESSSQSAAQRASVVSGGERSRIEGQFVWQTPFNAFSAANWQAMYAQLHFHRYGTTREQMAQIALNARRNAMVNPRAVFREPLTMDDYMSARMISTPFCLYDCDVPIDGSAVVIVSHIDAAKDCRKRPLRIEAAAGALWGRDSWDQRDDLTTMACFDAGARLWSRTDLKPADVDVAELYDGFSFLTMLWLEGLGFCGKGESGPFIEGGSRIARDGELPLNTNGGQLSAGRLHAYGLLHEACVQLWQEAGEHQVLGTPEVAIAGAGGGPLASCVLLTRQ